MEPFHVYQNKIAEWEQEIEAQLKRFKDLSDVEIPEGRPGRGHYQKNAPRIDIRGHLYRMTGVDLTKINGVDSHTVLKVIR